MFPLPNRLVELIVFILVPLTNVGCTVTAQWLPFTVVTHVALVRYPESLLKADTFVGTVGIVGLLVKSA